ncbi:hypothetical protein A9Q84_08960 [Halobacteriovorax marinus]|uniref:Uncharacterized protein n=1 Tax=Halobacteriovorax marinus TaxID=97084 RepID=A0A1Y5FBX2_9BACT|nr:hypothetical protein A9Q84_08960 [Halobacteriovorax marinus]
MTKELIELANVLNNEMSELKLILNNMEDEVIKREEESSFMPFINQMKDKLDNISVRMFKYSQVDEDIVFRSFIEDKLDQLMQGSDIDFKLIGEMDFIIKSSERKLFTFLKIILLLAIKTDSHKVHIHQNTNYIFIKFNGDYSLIAPNEIKPIDNHTSALLESLNRFGDQCHLEFNYNKMVSEVGFKLSFKK